jgi:hypothetical protein
VKGEGGETGGDGKKGRMKGGERRRRILKISSRWPIISIKNCFPSRVNSV